MNNPSLKIALLFFSSVVYGQLTKAQVPAAKVDSLVETSMKKFNITGVSIGIVKDGQVIYTKGYGVKSILTKDKVDENTQFAIASNTKAFTTAALSILVEERKLYWHTKVKELLPDFKMYNDYVTENFTIEDLLTHRSGLGLGAGDLMFIPNGSDFTIKDVLSGFQYFKPNSAFRTKFDYDNLLYYVAGEVIAKVSGMSWEKFVQSRIIKPLGMEHSYASLALMKDKSNLAMPHAANFGKLKQIENFGDQINGAPGGIYANAADLCKWMLVQLNKGKYGAQLDQQLFSETSQKQMWTIHTATGFYEDKRYNTHFGGYGLGWFLNDIKGNFNVSHTGGLPGMLSSVSLYPDLNLGIVVLTNTDGGNSLFAAVSKTIEDSYMGLDDNHWIDKIYDEVESNQMHEDGVTADVWKKVASSSQKKIDPASYVGIYNDKWFGKAEVFLKGKQLWFKSYRSPKLSGPMSFYNASSFAIKWEYPDLNADAFAIFSLDEEGKAQSIKMRGISPSIDFSYDFQDLDFQRL
ncbi:serine hydrolase [Pedobacter cryoconitis]|uniref:CubicO group peptidase (Beta-lactamase class C family) n=1 Tax=Pedobacter cryoconitis TaxID=188932 RepID=A0A327SUH1_9SPHI|nr:serine hydrolase [Pedobacter cryoconitis]RAJ32976.1 CubicO group peptidase (beta-lactamase class C family) [Pedobacter cryoconitis]